MRNVEAQLIHDMKNTAMVLREAALQLHECRASLSPKTVEHLTEMVARRSDMLVRLLADLSTSHLAERDELDLTLQPVSVSAICTELLAERRLPAGTRITVDLADDAVAVADPVRVTQVLDNLLTNALRYGGPNVHVGAAREEGRIRLTVSDDGTGVSDELVETLFDAYVRGEASHGLGGSGLGLSIVRQLCNVMNGAIDYDGTHGARFTATFPAVPAVANGVGVDVAGAGHPVAFWQAEEGLVQGLVAYVANGLTAGEAVLVAATPRHRELLEAELAAIGIDPVAVAASGQYLPLDADALHDELPVLHHIDRGRFETLIGETVQRVGSRWRRFRVFGEIVDLYWRAGDQHLALELEACWNDLRERLPFPLLCGYELSGGECGEAILGCHDTVVAA